MKETGITYDVVFKLRFDALIHSFKLTKLVVDDVNNYNIIFINGGDSHSHPDYGTGCYACDRMYYIYNLRQPHIFEHSNVICDMMAFGSVKSMKDYCSMYEIYDEFNKNNEQLNHESIIKNNIKPHKIGNVYKVSHTESLYYLICSYPERILQKMMKNYMIYYQMCHHSI